MVDSTLNTLNSTPAEIMEAIRCKRERAAAKIGAQKTLSRRLMPSLTQKQGNAIANQLQMMKQQQEDKNKAQTVRQ